MPVLKSVSGGLTSLTHISDDDDGDDVIVNVLVPHSHFNVFPIIRPEMCEESA